MKKSVLSAYLFVVMTCASCAQKSDNKVEPVENPPFTAELLVEGLTNPWGMDFLPDGSLLITEKEGKLLHYKDGEKTEISGVPEVFLKGQGGLLDLVLHPDYENNGWLYLTYSSAEGDGDGGNTALMRAKLVGNGLTQKEVLYKATPNTDVSRHFGSRIAFDGDGYLYFSIGDRGNRDENPQDIQRDGGKIYRLNADGSIPTDNPFYTTDGAKKAIFSYGHRNPQGMAIHPTTGALWVNEHGPKGGDEINISEKGKNYGWPVITYGVNYSGTSITDETHQEGMEQPIHYWVPSIAPSGMAFVPEENYPGWEDSVLVGSLAFQYLERLVLDGTQVTKREKLMEDIGRVRNIKVGPDGLIYVAVEGKGIYKLLPK